MYDAIIVGARCAGSASALLLARMGYKVLLIDKAEFPSDTISSHQLQVPGGAFLKRWGLLDKLAAAGTPLAHTVTFDTGAVVLRGAFPDMDGVNGVHSPRRRILDTILLNAAQEAGAEVRTHFDVDELLRDGDHVTGVRGHTPHGSPVTEQAHIVIGADGKRSLVAEAANAPTYNERPILTCAYYTYWEGVPVTGGEMYSRQNHAIGVWPTNDGQVITYLGLPRNQFDTFRANVEENFIKEMAVVPQLAERLRAGKRADRIYGTGDNPNFFRKPYGPGWALAGDAGYIKDPITGRGMSDAFRDADLLATALHSAWSGQQPLDTALASYEQQRNKASMPAYEFTCQLASFAPPAPEQLALFSALANNPEQTNRFFGVSTGAISSEEFFSPTNMRRILGFKGLAKIALQKISHRGGPAAQPTQAGASAR
jgi:2-polyprenyl-6-methoxyphenol hydroxylase-like FAD-dependent oxidoreductase